MFLCQVYLIQFLSFTSLGSSGGIYKLKNLSLTITLQWPLVSWAFYFCGRCVHSKRRFTCKVNPY